MKIIVALKRVYDHNTGVKVNIGQTGVDLTNVCMAMNPYCKVALEAAIRLKEAGLCSEVMVVIVGSAVCDEQLRQAFALGADKGVRIDVEDEEGLTPIAVAKLLTALVRQCSPGLVMLGKASVDYSSSQVGPMVAGLLDWPQGAFVSALDVDDNKVTVTQEVDGGKENIRLTMPAIITTDLGLNTPRYASMRNTLQAKRKPIDTISAEMLGVTLRSHTQVLKVYASAKRSRCQVLESVEQLIDKLKHEAKVI